MINKSKINFLGGIPDILFMKCGNIIHKKNNLSYEIYLKSLSFYQEYNTSFFSLPSSAPEFKLDPENNFDGNNYLFKSNYQPRNSLVAGEFNSFKKNKNTSVRIWQHSNNKNERPPIVLCLHGFMLGAPQIAKQMFKIEKLYNKEVDVALYTLPHHGNRTNYFLNQSLLNPHDIPLTIESMGQAIYDLHSTILILKKQGYKKIGLLGASLGGLTAILYTTLSKQIDFTFVTVPAVDLNQYLRPRNSLFNFKVTDELKNLTTQALQIITPQYHRPKLSPEKIGVVLHSGDKLNDSQLTQSWAQKWQVTNITKLPGGHWFYGNKKEKGRAWYEWLSKYEFIP